MLPSGKVLVLGMALLIVGYSLATTPAAGQQLPRGEAPNAGRGMPGGANESYNIVAVGRDPLQVVPKSTLKDLQKRVKEEDALALKSYQDAKKDKTLKDTVGAKPPEKRTVKIVKSGIKTQEEAYKALEKLEKERAGGGGGSSDKKKW